MTIKLLALDYGQKRVGVAVSLGEAAALEELPPGGLAFPRPALQRVTRQEFFQRFLALLESEAPAAIVLGLPLCADGSDSLTTRQVRNFAASLARRTALPIYLMDETLSSSEAESLLREAAQAHGGRSARSMGGGRSGPALAGREEGVVDSQAAVGILQSFLNLAPEQRRKRKYLGEAAS